jgi:EF hand
MKFVIKSWCASVAVLGLAAMSSLVSAQTTTAPAPAAHSASAPHGKHGKEHHNAADMFKKIDVNKDGFISRDEAKGHKDLEKHFDEMDTNKDGQISPEELKAYHQKHKR